MDYEDYEAKTMKRREEFAKKVCIFIDDNFDKTDEFMNVMYFDNIYLDLDPTDEEHMTEIEELLADFYSSNGIKESTPIDMTTEILYDRIAYCSISEQPGCLSDATIARMTEEWDYMAGIYEEKQLIKIVAEIIYILIQKELSPFC